MKIDTEGGFTIERLAEIAEETVLHINDTADEEKNEGMTNDENL